MPATDSISANEIHLWYSPVPGELDAGLAEQYLALLTPEESAQLKRFFFDKDKRRYLTTRALVRSVMSRYVPVEPAAWRFRTNPYGRPAIANDHPHARHLEFNISHTDSTVVLAMTSGRDIGVDIENTARPAPLEVADRFFSKHEAAELRRLPHAQQAHRFWELWTFKESYIKARGMGLSLPLDKFSLHFRDHEDVSIFFDAELEESPGRWDLWQLRPEAANLVAVCTLRTGDTEPTTFVCTRITPLSHMRDLDVRVTRRVSGSPWRLGLGT